MSEVKNTCVVNSLSEIGQLVDIHQVTGRRGLISVVTMAVKYVKRNGVEEDYYSKDILLDSDSSLPELATDNRLDVYNFYNTKLTNLINRKLRNTVSKTVLTGDTIKQYKVIIESYTGDLPALKTSKNEDVKFVADTTKLLYLINDDNLLDEVNSRITTLAPTLGTDADAVLPLIFLEQFDVLPVKLPIFKNSRLEKGEALALTNDDLVNVTDINRETILLDTNTSKMYILDKNRYGKLSIRLTKVDEIFTNTLIDF